MASISLEGVSKSFGDTTIVRHLDLEIESGAFVSLLGPSGCGKTTLLRMIAGLEQPTAGVIRIGDRVVNHVSPGERDIAMVFQSYALYPQMTVARNIEYPLRKRGVARAERARMVAEVAEMLRLGPLLDRKPRQLSGGQQQRVALGRALVRQPRAFLLDEPLSNLDATLRTHMRGELVDLHRRIGKTMVYVTHDQLEAMTMSTHIAIIDGGVLHQFGAPDLVYRRPANRMVASFIGTPAMSFLDADLRREGGETAILVAGQPIARAAGLDAARPVSLGVRAEHVRIGEPGVPATVRHVEPIGHETIVRLVCAGGDLTARVAADARFAPGQQISFRLVPEHIHLFDRDGERARVDVTIRPAIDASSPIALDH
jgi:multiple sugar transport system ATP-binding protein